MVGRSPWKKAESRMNAEDLICQPKKDETKNLNVYEQLGSICLPLSLEKGKLG